MIRLKTWKQRLDDMDHSKGTSNVMIQKCMTDEIASLRATLDCALRQRDMWKKSAKKYRNRILTTTQEKRK